MGLQPEFVENTTGDATVHDSARKRVPRATVAVGVIVGIFLPGRIESRVVALADDQQLLAGYGEDDAVQEAVVGVGVVVGVGIVQQELEQHRVQL